MRREADGTIRCVKIYSWNVNGLRAVSRKGALADFLGKESPDVLLLQEIKMKEDQAPEDLPDDDFETFYNSPEKPGYSGVAIWVNKKHASSVQKYEKGMPGWKDGEGRVAQCFLDGELVVISVYVPNGGKSDAAYAEKLEFFTLLAAYATKLQEEGYRIAVCGDFNVARSELDLSNPEKHRNHTHFNDEVRSHMEKLTQAGLVDSYRMRNPGEEGAFSYWDNFSFSLPRGTKPRDVNMGWRLDYCMVDERTNAAIAETHIHQNIYGSDHCPVSFSL